MGLPACSRCNGTEDVQPVRMARNRSAPFEVVEVPLERGSECPSCGQEELSDEPCSECGGDKYVTTPLDAACEYCHGTGNVDRDDATMTRMQGEGVMPSPIGRGGFAAWCAPCRAENERRMRQEAEA